MFHEKFCVGKLSYRQTFESTNDPSALRRSFYQFLPHRAKTENTRWGVKILAHFWTQRDLDLFLQAFPRVEIVYVVRDGRDVLLSLMKRSKLLSTPEQCVNVWFRSIEVLDYLRSKMPDHLLWYYYEDLVTNPEAKVREICEFLGEPFRASMLDHRTWPGLGSYEISPILTDKVGKWKEQKLPDLPRELDERFRATLARMGYGDEPARVGADQPR
jgi:hypothetical protein